MTEPSPGTLLDSNVLLDVLFEDPVWRSWSERQIGMAAERGTLLINPVVYAEVSVRFSAVESFDAVLGDDIVRTAIPWDAAFLAGKAFVQYRNRGGTRRSPLPDFFVGAHAVVLGLRLLTRDAARYRTYFPTVDVIAPDTAG